MTHSDTKECSEYQCGKLSRSYS